MIELVSLKEEGTRAFSFSLLYEAIARRWPCENQEQSPHQTPNLLTPILDFLPPELNICCVNRPICSILLQQPKLTKTLSNSLSLSACGSHTPKFQLKTTQCGPRILQSMKMRLNDLLKGLHLFTRERGDQYKSRKLLSPQARTPGPPRPSPLLKVPFHPTLLSLSEHHHISATLVTSLRSPAWSVLPHPTRQSSDCSPQWCIHSERKLCHHIALWLVNFASLFLNTLRIV